MGATSRLVILACLITIALAKSGWCANFVYKGTQTTVDVGTGEKFLLSAYLVLAENGAVDVSDDYVRTNVRMLIVGGIAGRKGFVRVFPPEYRTLHLATIVGGKPRAVVIVSRSVATSNVDSHIIETEALTGAKKDPAERMPAKLQGVAVLGSGEGHNLVATGGIHLSASKYSLVRDLTEQVQPGETLDQTEERVIAFLQSKGFSETSVP